MAKSPKTIALGGALRAARQSKGYTLREFAEHMGFDAAILSRWETGLRTPKPEQVAQILATLGVVGERYRELMTLARDTDRDHWIATTPLEQQQHFAAFLEAERNAAVITSVSPSLVPGLLQTAEYARAILVAGTSHSMTEIEARVDLRVSRAEVLFRPIPAQYTALIGEAALRQHIGGPAVHLLQLRRLLAVSARPNVDLRVLPFATGWHPGLEGAFHMFSGVTLIPSVYMESRTTQTWLHKPEDVNVYRRAAREALESSLSASDSVRFITALARRMEQRSDNVAEIDKEHERS